MSMNRDTVLQEAAMFLLPLLLVTVIIVGCATRGKLGFCEKDAFITG